MGHSFFLVRKRRFSRTSVVSFTAYFILSSFASFVPLSIPIAAHYLGDTNNATSASAAVSQVVNSLPVLTVTKVVINDNGGTVTVGSVPLFVNGSPVTSGVSASYSVGPHTVSETNPAGYTAAISGNCAADGTITLALNNVKSCTITDDDQPAHLTVIKQVTNDDGGTLAPNNFTISITGPNASPASFPGSSVGTSVTIDAGVYSVSETPVTGYLSSRSADCSGILAPGESKTCTITNNNRPGFPFPTTGGGGTTRPPIPNGAGGSNVNHLSNAINFMLGRRGRLAPGAFGGGTELTLSTNDKELICKIRKMSRDLDPGNMAWLAGYIGSLIGKNADSVKQVLLNPSACASTGPSVMIKKINPVAVHLDKNGYVVSLNPVWNACTNGRGLTLALIKSNRDHVEQRDHKGRPLTCRDYHINDNNVWQHPDFPGLQVQLDQRGRLNGSLPSGFVATRDTTIAGK